MGLAVQTSLKQHISHKSCILYAAPPHLLQAGPLNPHSLVGADLGISGAATGHVKQRKFILLGEGSRG